MKTKDTILILIFLVAFSYVKGQLTHEISGDIQPLIVGNRVSPDFWTREHLFYVNGDTVRRSLESYKGKLLILDFWSTSCGPCLLHQKEMREVLKKYPNHFNVLMVNSVDTKDDLKRIDQFYKKNKEDYFRDHDFCTIIDDRRLYKQFPHLGFPSYVWINRINIFQLQTFRNLLDLSLTPPFLTKNELDGLK